MKTNLMYLTDVLVYSALFIQVIEICDEKYEKYHQFFSDDAAEAQWNLRFNDVLTEKQTVAVEASWK